MVALQACQLSASFGIRPVLCAIATCALDAHQFVRGCDLAGIGADGVHVVYTAFSNYSARRGCR